MRSLMADRYIECEVARLIAYNVAYMQGEGLIPTREASMSKVFGSETVRRVTEAALDVLGLYGTLGREEKWASANGPRTGTLDAQLFRHHRGGNLRGAAEHHRQPGPGAATRLDRITLHEAREHSRGARSCAPAAWLGGKSNLLR